ncbi:hypothetical protein RJ641_006582 [Dillenia turbinata]|uniref:Uncharacterized protein n=1 Tax=Dillenia turbinata TaxID=194707 RepID=A0AAN8Z7P8_9MAGN
MAGLIAWAVGKGTESEEDEDPNSIPIVFTPEQQRYATELDIKASSLTRSIQDLRLRLPPPDISQRLPHLHAHSLASNAALALQLNAHSATREQAQLREVTLQEENATYEKAISDCKNKIQEKLQQADQIRKRLEELNIAEENLRSQVENAQPVLDSQSCNSGEPSVNLKQEVVTDEETEASKSALLEKIESKEKELQSIEEGVKDLENQWAKVQDNVLKQPSPAQREKILDKQLHSLIEQLATKQAQAEGLIGEIHLKEKELEKLNGMWRHLETNTIEASTATARNRFRRSGSKKGYTSSESISDSNQKLPYHFGGRNENQERLMLLRSSFALYILALHILVFIKISF